MNIFNLSFGKDSMATLILAYEQRIPIDRVMYCDIRFSPEISGEHPLMAAWIQTAEQRLKELFGVTVDHSYSGVSFYEQFYKVKQKGNHVVQQQAENQSDQQVSFAISGGNNAVHRNRI